MGIWRGLQHEGLSASSKEAHTWGAQVAGHFLRATEPRTSCKIQVQFWQVYFLRLTLFAPGIDFHGFREVEEIAASEIEFTWLPQCWRECGSKTWRPGE